MFHDETLIQSFAQLNAAMCQTGIPTGNYANPTGLTGSESKIDLSRRGYHGLLAELLELMDEAAGLFAGSTRLRKWSGPRSW